MSNNTTRSMPLNVKSLLPALLIAFVMMACKSEKKALTAFKYAKYEKTISYFKGVLAKHPTSAKANYYMAESYRLSNRIKESEPYYEKATDYSSKKDSVNLFHAQSLQANGKYDLAKQSLGEIVASTSNTALKARAQQGINGLNFLTQLESKKNYYRVKNLEALNTAFAEYGPSYSNSELYFTSSRGSNKLYEATGTPFTDLYKVETKGAIVDLATLKVLPEPINMPNVNTGSITFSADGKLMIFARGNSGKRNGKNDVDLYLSRFVNGKWSDPIPTTINQPDSWESTPALSPDGRTLYFSSNRRGGFGGLDLYSAQMDGRGRFGKVRNLGPDFNTAGDELFPYVADNGRLYFSSDGHPGFGMLDIFVVNRANGKNSIDNLGPTVNSTGDDFGIFLFKVDRGFFTSNREGGKGDDDIYTFINDDPNLKVANYYLAGVAYTTRRDSTKEILSDTQISLLDANGNGMQEAIVDSKGKFLFRVYENENYFLRGEHDGYLTKRQRFTTKGKSVPLESLSEMVNNITLDTLIVLDKKEKNKRFVLNNIYFAYDKADINPEAAQELDKLVELLNDNPEIKIELGSHTDSVSTDAYNLELSQRRAESTVKYLIHQGIDPKRLVAKGYGERVPIARNTNIDGTDNPAGRQKNRRTEFRILEIDNVIKNPDGKNPNAPTDEDKYFNDTEKDDTKH